MKLLILITGSCFAVCHASMELVRKPEDAVNVKVIPSSHVNREKREASQVFKNAISTRNERADVYKNITKRSTDVLSADDQCIRELGEGSHFCPGSYPGFFEDFEDFSVMCTTGLCLTPGDVTCEAVTLDEFTTCGNQKWCIDGECVFDEDAPVTSSDLCPQGDSAGQDCNLTTEQCEALILVSESAFLDCCETCSETTATTTTTTSTTTPTTTTSTTTPTTTTSTTEANTLATQTCSLYSYLTSKCSNPPVIKLNRFRIICERCRNCRYIYSLRRRWGAPCRWKYVRIICRLLSSFDNKSRN